MSAVARSPATHAVRADRRSAMLATGWALCISIYLGLAAWLFAHPAALPSDDALFLAHGLARFDVLDLSPQFPGYPGFIALGRLILSFVHDPASALFILTVSLALMLPPAASALVWRAGRSRPLALAGFAVTLTMPLLPDLGLSMLTDGAGILFVLVALALLPRRDGEAVHAATYWLCGTALGWAACCRPSDAVLIAGALAGILWRVPRRAAAMLGGMAIVGLPVLAFVYAHEGTLYLWEGVHFVAGHALDWGDTPFSTGAPHTGWLAALATIPGGRATAALFTAAATLALWRGRAAPPAMTAMAFAFAGHLLWVVLMQNPAHLRHLAPLAVLGALMLVLGPVDDRRRAVAVTATLALNALGLSGGLDPTPGRLPPLARAAALLAAAPAGSSIALNDGVEVLRAGLPALQIYDFQNRFDAALGLDAAAGAAYRLSTTPLGPRPLAVYRGRVPGETTMRLYRWKRQEPPAPGS